MKTKRSATSGEGAMAATVRAGGRHTGTKKKPCEAPVQAAAGKRPTGARRAPQLALRLDLAAPDPAAQWRDGARLTYLGRQLVLWLDTERRTATLDDDVLHLPLPPEASPRQIQDGAETWLRKEAERLLTLSVAVQARAQARPVPACSLSFAARASWVQPDGRGGLRCNWRLIELPLPTIEQVIAAGLAKLPATVEIDDLFAFA